MVSSVFENISIESSGGGGWGGGWGVVRILIHLKDRCLVIILTPNRRFKSLT